MDIHGNSRSINIFDQFWIIFGDMSQQLGNLTRLFGDRRTYTHDLSVRLSLEKGDSSGTAAPRAKATIR